MRYLFAIILISGCTSGTANLPVPEVSAGMGVALTITTTPENPSDECERCWGKGKIPFEDTGRMITCPDCNGTGTQEPVPVVDDALDTVPTPGASTVSPSATEPAESPAIAATDTDGDKAGLLLDQGDCCAVLEKLIKKETKTYDGIQWVSEEEAREMSKAGMWVIAYFTGDGCRRCEELKRYVFPDREAIAAAKDFVFFEVRNGGRRWGIDRYPGMILIAPGMIIHKRAYPPSNLEGFIYLLSRWREVQ